MRQTPGNFVEVALDGPNLTSAELGVKPTKGRPVPDKSPQRPAGKKPGKTLKEKRADKQAKQQSKHSLNS